MAILYRINKWSEFFENNRTRDLNRMSFACIPNKQDGDGYTELLDHFNGTAHYGAWIALVLVASKRPKGSRGVLVRDSGHPHDARTLARMTRIPESIISEAIPRLLEIGWLAMELVDDKGITAIPHEGAGIPQPPADSPPPPAAATCASHAGAGSEWNGEKGGSERPEREARDFSDFDVTDTTLRDIAALRTWYGFEVRRSDGWLGDSESNWNNVQAAAAKARKAPLVHDPIALFKWLVGDQRWGWIPAKYEDIAREMAREQDARAGPPLPSEIAEALVGSIKTAG